MSAEPLKPCPFCGGDDVRAKVAFHTQDDTDWDWYAVLCSECLSEGPWVPSAPGDTSDAIELWNTRTEASDD